MKARKLLVLMVVALFCVSALLAGCSGGNANTAEAADSSEAGESAASSDLTIGVVVKTMGNPFFREIAWGAVQAGEALGVKVIPLATQAEGQLDEQIKICEDLIVQGVDALVVTPQHSEGIVPAVEAAHAAGIPFIAVDTDVVGGDSATGGVPDCFVGMDNVEAGYIIGKMVCEKMGGEGNVVILQGMAGASSSIERTEGYEKACAEYPGITIVASQNANFQQDIAQQTMADILQANKDIKGVLSCGDLMALGAIISLEEAGYKVGGDDGVVIGSYDICVQILEAVQNGTVAVEGYHWGELYGYWGVEMAIRAANGEPIPERVVSPHSEITQDNVAPFLEKAKMLEGYEFPS
ncbi:MAG: sugar ABC transporter substrate-binding protein [Christensenellaceae bacterium]|jgi:ribose transport system substrate-binding protein